MPNPALTEKIRNLPPLLDSLERDAEVSDLLRRSDAARERFRQMFPLDGVEQSALDSAYRLLNRCFHKSTSAGASHGQSDDFLAFEKVLEKGRGIIVVVR